MVKRLFKCWYCEVVLPSSIESSITLSLNFIATPGRSCSLPVGTNPGLLEYCEWMARRRTTSDDAVPAPSITFSSGWGY